MKLKTRAIVWLLQKSRRLHVWAIMQSLPPIYRVARAKDFLWNGMVILKSDVQAMLDQSTTERDIVTARLARRYDPGMALNEAFARAEEKIRDAPEATPAAPDEDPIAAHYRQMREKPPELSARQKAALAHQETFLRRNLANKKRG